MNSDSSYNVACETPTLRTIVIKNDRDCIEIHARKMVDKANPRVEFAITEYTNIG